MIDPLVTGIIAILVLLSFLAGALIARSLVFKKFVEPLQKERDSLKSSKQSLATTYGKITEQFAPFMADYPYDPQRFRFIGTPIDGIQFNDDEIVFVEIKASNSRLSPLQARIRNLIEEKRIRWLEFKIR